MFRDEVTVTGATYQNNGDAALTKSKAKSGTRRQFTLYRLNRTDWYAFRQEMLDHLDDGDTVEVFTIDATSRGIANLLNGLFIIGIEDEKGGHVN
jgi:hypothetical protein